MRTAYSLTGDIQVLLDRIELGYGRVNYVAEVEFYPSFNDMLAVLQDWVNAIRSINENQLKVSRLL